MEWHLSSFFLNNEEAFIQLNPNILETNVQNLVILIGILVYANNVSFSVSLENRFINPLFYCFKEKQLYIS